jgi:hypothetical protein
MEIMKPPLRSAARFRPLFLNLIRRHLEPLAGDSDRVTGIAIIHEINIARQNPTVYATFLEPTRQKYAGRVCLMPGSVRVCTREGVRAVEEAIRFLRRARPLPPLALSPGLCVQRLIIVVSKPAVPSDITVGMGAIQEIESVLLGWSRKVGRRTLLMVNILPAPLSWRSSLMMVCGVVVIAGTFPTPISKAPERLTVHMPDAAVFAVSILPAATSRARSHVPGPMPRSRFNDVTPVIGRDAADFALFRESVERMDQP